jgi:carbamoyltransferase
VNSGEYKLMGLAPYGKPVYVERIVQHLVDLRPDGSFRMDMRYFGYLSGLAMTNRRFAELFDGPPRAPESEITQRELDLAASIQVVTEEIVMRMARHAARTTGERNAVLAGGVALNCVANGELLRDGPFDNIWVQPAAGDAGGAVGAALYGWHMVLGKPRYADGVHDAMHGAYLGPQFPTDEIAAWLDAKGYPYERLTGETRDRAVAERIARGDVVGMLQGRMEFGPRALGHRSILGDPRSSSMQSTMNLKIKYRESFRPFAPAVLDDHAAKVFEIEPGVESPYMLLVAGVRPELRVAPDDDRERSTDLREWVNEVRSRLPAITHVDYSARLQTVAPDSSPKFHGVIAAFEELTGCPVVINTSFNVRGEPIVCTPDDAYRCFMRTEMDTLVLEDCILSKADQPAFADVGSWQTDFVLD